MRIVITGATGLLGKDLWSVLSQHDHELFGIGRDEKPVYLQSEQWIKLDLTCFSAAYNLITKVNPELIIHTAALSDVEECQRHPEQAYLVNALATRNIALACQRFDTTLLYVSTDYVFDGQNMPANGYREIDRINPLNEYALSKYWGECYVQWLLNKFYIVRTAWLFGQARTTLVSSIVQKIKQGKVLTVAEDQVGCPTYVLDLAKAISQLIETNLFGIYHLTNGGYCSRLELTKKIIELIGKKEAAIKTVKLAEFSQLLAPRPLKSALDNFCWRISGFKPLRPWSDALADFLTSETFFPSSS